MSYRNRPRTEKEMFREIFRRLDDLERIPVSPVERRGSQVWFVDPGNGTEILLAPECPCGDPGTIWLSSTLREGDTTWTSLDGDTRSLDPVPAATTADGGLVWGSLTSTPLRLLFVERLDGDNTVELGGGVFVVDYEVSTWWDHPDGTEHYTYSAFQSTAVDVNAPADFDPPPPPDREYELRGHEEPVGDETDRIDSDPPAVGLTGFARGRIRAEVDLATYDAELWLATPGGPLISQGSKTFPDTPIDFLDLYFFKNDHTVAPSGGGGSPLYPVPNFGARSVLHAFSIEHDGVVLARMTAAQVAAATSDLSVGGSQPQKLHPVNATRRLAGGFVFAPGGAPLMIRKHVSGTQDPDDDGVPVVFTDGDDLEEPAIAWATAVLPHEIIISNEDPKTWEPTASAVVYGVCDLAAFSDVTDGWPTGYWPLGTTGT